MRPDAGSTVISTLAIARAAADAATAHDDVLQLDAGLAGAFATYGRDGRVAGVQVDAARSGPTQVRVRLVVHFGRPLPDIGDEVRARITAVLSDLVDDVEVDVHIADITTEVDRAPDLEAPAAELDPPGAS